MITVTILRIGGADTEHRYDSLDRALKALELKRVHLDDKIEGIYAEDAHGRSWTLCCDHCFEWIADRDGIPAQPPARVAAGQPISQRLEHRSDGHGLSFREEDKR